MANESNTDNSTHPMDDQGLHPDAPRHKSPLKWMLLVIVSLVAVTTYSMWGKEKISIKATVTIPELSEQGLRGREVFASACAQCHGADGSGGSRTGPPLIHPMYRDTMYPDFVLKQVILNGKREKNWRFGPMPAIENLNAQQVDDIIIFIRAAQVASGIN